MKSGLKSLWFTVAAESLSDYVGLIISVWPESEKDVFQAALSMVVVKDSR